MDHDIDALLAALEQAVAAARQQPERAEYILATARWRQAERIMEQLEWLLCEAPDYPDYPDE